MYRANICADTLVQCSGAVGAATETLHIPAGETCRVLGRYSGATIESTIVPLTENNPSGHGVTIHYYGGDPCGDPSESSDRTTSIKLICNNGLDVSGVLTSVQREMSCTTILTIESPYACPATTGLTLMSCLVFVFLAVMIYIVGGSYYNFTKYDLRGYEMLPHREFWMQVGEKIQEHALLAYEFGLVQYNKYFNVEDPKNREFVTKKVQIGGDAATGYGSTDTL